MKIDFYTHILPRRYYEELKKKGCKVLEGTEQRYPYVIDVEARLRLMDRYPDVLQVITVMQPPLEEYFSPEDAVELAKIANEEVAELVIKYPNKFFAGVACLPMNDIPSAVNEIDRAVNHLGLKGIQIYSRINGKALDSPEFRPVFERMARYDLPIWVHPIDAIFSPRNTIAPLDAGAVGLLFETSYMMNKLVSGGVFREFPNLKVITHHCGAMIPVLEKRLPDADIFKKFYCDTATYGSTLPIKGAYDFFGADHILFGTDSPLGPKFGCTLDVINAVERMPIMNEEKEKIFLNNALNLLKLSI